MGFRAINLVNSRMYRSVYQEYKKKYGEKESEQIWRKAGQLYEEFLTNYQENSPVEKIEAQWAVLKGIAIFKTIQKKHPDEAMKFMEDGMKAYGKSRHGKIKKGLMKKYQKRLFLFRYTVRWKFWRPLESGYVYDDIYTGKFYQKMRVKVEECPFKEYCSRESVPELTHIFCDLYSTYYNNIPGITYHKDIRKEDEKIKECDIYMGVYQNDLKAAKKKKEEEKKKRRDKWKKRFFYV